MAAQEYCHWLSQAADWQQSSRKSGVDNLCLFHMESGGLPPSCLQFWSRSAQEEVQQLAQRGHWPQSKQLLYLRWALWDGCPGRPGVSATAGSSQWVSRAARPLIPGLCGGHCCNALDTHITVWWTAITYFRKSTVAYSERRDSVCLKSPTTVKQVWYFATEASHCICVSTVTLPQTSVLAGSQSTPSSLNPNLLLFCPVTANTLWRNKTQQNKTQRMLFSNNLKVSQSLVLASQACHWSF